MKNGSPIIFIRAMKDKPGFYLAYFESEILQATISLHFKDTIVGAIALNNFVEMLRIKQNFRTYTLKVDDSIMCQNKAVLDVIELYNADLEVLPMN